MRMLRYMYVGQVLVAAQQIGIRKVAFLTEPDHLGAVTPRRTSSWQ